jgi:hypothetical protein
MSGPWIQNVLYNTPSLQRNQYASPWCGGYLSSRSPVGIPNCTHCPSAFHAHQTVKLHLGPSRRLIVWTLFERRTVCGRLSSVLLCGSRLHTLCFWPEVVYPIYLAVGPRRDVNSASFENTSFSQCTHLTNLGGLTCFANSVPLISNEMMLYTFPAGTFRSGLDTVGLAIPSP